MFHRIGEADRDGSAVVLFSGGQDSTTCLVQALRTWRPENVHAVAFNYGQRHKTELMCATDIAYRLGIGHHLHVLNVEALSELGGAALTNPDIPVSTDATGTGNIYAEQHGLPSTFVPGRNMVFLSLATALAAEVGARHVVTGVCEADRAGYPDCRPEFVSAAELALRQALGTEDLLLIAPLLYLTKAATFALAADLDALDLIVNETSTCYNGVNIASHDDEQEQLYPWGWGCGECGACAERAAGWSKYCAMMESEEER